MSRFTKTSSFPGRAAAGAVLVLAMVLAAPVRSSAGVLVRVAGDSGKGVAFARQRALDSAVMAAASVIANRHTLPEERLLSNEKLKSVLAGAAGFARRYAIVSETVDGNSINIRVDVDLDREGLLKSLEKAGFKIMRLDFKPRMFLSVAPDPDSRALGYELGRLLKDEGIDASIADASGKADSPADGYLSFLRKGGYHVGVKLGMAPPPPPRPMEGEPGFEGPPKAEIPPSAPESDEAEELALDFGCTYEMLDAAAGSLLGRRETVALGKGADRDAAVSDAAEKAAEEILNLIIADLTRSDFGKGRGDAGLEIAVSGIDSPGSVAEMTALLAAMAEFRDVRLVRLEYARAVWLVRAVDSGSEWLSVLSRVRPGRADISWVRGKGSASQAGPLSFEGRWLGR